MAGYFPSSAASQLRMAVNWAAGAFATGLMRMKRFPSLVTAY
jgi:hypothetical protein